MMPLSRLCRALAFLLAAAPFLPARTTPEELFARANAFYQQGDFAAAERAYRELAAAGIDSGELYYNLGNACFKQNKLGEAVYFWERAARRLPGDADVRENLELARGLVVDRLEVPESPLPLRWLSAALHRFTPSQESWAAFAFFVAGNVLLGIYLLARTPRLARCCLAGCLTAAVLFVLVSASLAWKLYERTHRPEGVIVSQVVEMRSGPGKGYLTVATIHEGLMVRIRGRADDWYQIVLPNGWSGWLPAESLRVLE